MEDILWNTFYVEDFHSVIQFNQARIKKEKIGAHIKMGVNLKIRKIISLDFYGGLGYGYVNIDYFDIKNVNPSSEEFFEDMIPQYNRHNGSLWDIHLTLGLKIGIVISK
jgi:hypothetical protein